MRNNSVWTGIPRLLVVDCNRSIVYVPFPTLAKTFYTGRSSDLNF
jgi:hypothetical protein